MSDQSEGSRSPSPSRDPQPEGHNILVKDILVITVRKDGHQVREIVPNIDIRPFLNEDQELVLCKLLDKLKSRYSFPMEFCEVSFYLYRGQVFMGCGTDPISDDVVLRQSQYSEPEIIIRFKEYPCSLIHKLMSEEMNEKTVNQRDEEEGNEVNKCRRTKERRIGYIIDKVVKWRQLYTGTKEDGVIRRLSLEDAANKVGISKKSLDDYLLQVRFGRKYGFNFNEHKNDKVGILRDYVRKHKKSMKVDSRKKKKGNKPEQID